jgi:hypothetical protein
VSEGMARRVYYICVVSGVDVSGVCSIAGMFVCVCGVLVIYIYIYIYIYITILHLDVIE